MPIVDDEHPKVNSLFGARFSTNGHKPKSDLPELAYESNLIAAISRDIEAGAIVGESDKALLVYFIYTSRLLTDPGSVVTRGITGIGKSTLLKKVAAFMPSESIIESMSMSAASWFNTAPDYFKHKIFLGGERKHSVSAEAKDAGAMLRQLLGEKRINRMVCVPNPADPKVWDTVPVEREGPVAYAESTTSGSIFEEDLNRMLQVYLDASEEQNKRVVSAIASKYDPGRAELDFDKVIKKHHDFQRYLQGLGTIRVGVPYWKQLAECLPTNKSDCRRVIQQVFTMIEASVLLHHHDREERDGCVLATMKDYKIVRQLLVPSLHAVLGLGEDFNKYLELRKKVPGPRFTTPEVKEAMGFKDNMGPSRLLNALVKAEMIIRVSPQSGRTPAVYRYAGKEGPNLETMVLPTVEQIEAAGFA